MKHANSILIELQELAPFLASLQKNNAFQVPENYFEATTVNQLNVSNLKPNPNELIWASKNGAFTTPDGYFEQFSELLEKQINTLPFQVSENSLPFSKVNSLTVPEGYFENFADQLVAQINAAKPFKESIELPFSKSNSFAVPESYFEENVSTILNKVNQLEAPAGKRIVWNSFATIRRIAIAASIMTVLFGSLWLVQLQSMHTANDSLTAQELSSFMDNNSDELTEQMLMENKSTPTEASKKGAMEEKNIKDYIDNEVDESTLNELL